MARLQNIISRNRKVRPAKRCRRHAQRKTKTRSRKHVADHFLTQSFYPVTSLLLTDKCRVINIERAFMQSVKYVCDLYGCPYFPLDDSPFPVNVYLTFEKLREELQKKDEDLQVLITGCVERPMIATAKALNLNYNLYYIPLQPLHTLLSGIKTRSLGLLLLSAFNYLYRIGVALCDASSFIGYEMVVVRDGMDDYDQIDEHELQERKDEADQIISLCKELCSQIEDDRQRAGFPARMVKAKASSEKECKIFEAVYQLYDLQSDFPDRRFTDQIPDREMDDPDDRTMFTEQYLSFYWGGNSTFDDQVGDWIDTYLQETTEVQLPVSIQVFDRPHERPTHNFAFEDRLLKCITQLNTALYDYTR